MRAEYCFCIKNLANKFCAEVDNKKALQQILLERFNLCV